MWELKGHSLNSIKGNRPHLYHFVKSSIQLRCFESELCLLFQDLTYQASFTFQYLYPLVAIGSIQLVFNHWTFYLEMHIYLNSFHIKALHCKRLPPFHWERLKLSRAYKRCGNVQVTLLTHPPLPVRSSGTDLSHTFIRVATGVLYSSNQDLLYELTVVSLIVSLIAQDNIEL